MLKADKINVAKAIEIYAELELQEIVGFGEIDAFGAPSECKNLLLPGFERARIEAEKAAGCTESELEKLCREIGFNYRRVHEKVLDRKMSKCPWFV